MPLLYTVVNGAWTPVAGSTVNAAAGTVSASLSHFSVSSTYGLLATNALSQPALRAIAGDISGANAGNNLSWSASVDPGAGAVTYSIYRSTTQAFTISASTLLVSGLTTTSYHDTTAAAGTTYYYAISASARRLPDGLFQRRQRHSRRADDQWRGRPGGGQLA